MSDSPLTLLCLLVATGCLVTMTIVVAMLARDVRALARRVHHAVPAFEALVTHAQQAVRRMDAVLERADGALHDIGAVTKRASAAAVDLLDAIGAARQTTGAWLREHFGHGLGNGTGSRRPRRASRGEQEGGTAP